MRQTISTTTIIVLLTALVVAVFAKNVALVSAFQVSTKTKPSTTTPVERSLQQRELTRRKLENVVRLSKLQMSTNDDDDVSL
jgi:hypothetical protein